MSWKVKVRVSRDGKPGLELAFDRSPITLGARPDNDVVLNDPYVSGAHALVIVSGGGLIVRDRSRNGSFFEGRRISEQAIGEGGVLSIPPFEVELRFEPGEVAWQTIHRTDAADLLVQVRAKERQAAAGEAAVTLPAESALAPTEPKPSPPAAPAPKPPPQPHAPPASEETVPTYEMTPPAGRRTGPAPLPPQPAAAPRGVAAEGPPPVRQEGAVPTVAEGPDWSRTLILAEPAHHRPAFLSLGDASPEVPSTEFSLPAHPVRLGRSEGADLRIPIQTVSRLHAAIHPLPDGTYLLTDLNSSNGTFVNGQRVQVAELHGGDAVQLGQVSLTFSVSDDEPEPARRKTAPARRAATSGPQLDVVSRSLATDGSVVVFEIAGRIDGYNYTQVADTLDQAIEGGARYLVVDLSKLEYVGHTGLGVLVKGLARLEKLRGDLCLVGLSQRLLDAFSLCHLDGLFRGRFAASQEAALARWKARL